MAAAAAVAATAVAAVVEDFFKVKKICISIYYKQTKSSNLGPVDYTFNQ